MKKNSKTAFITGSGQNTAKALPVIWEQLALILFQMKVPTKNPYMGLPTKCAPSSALQLQLQELVGGVADNIKAGADFRLNADRAKIVLRSTKEAKKH